MLKKYSCWWHTCKPTIYACVRQLSSWIEKMYNVFPTCYLVLNVSSSQSIFISYVSSGPYTQSIIRFFFLYIKLMCPYFILLIYTDGERDGLWMACPFRTLVVLYRNVSIYYMSNINELPDGILFHWFCKCTPPWMFLPLDIPSEYRPEHVTFGLLCVIFKFPSRIFCRRVPGFATDCPCGVWCRGLTTCLLYVGPPLEF